jgi:hypothetical protein
LIDQSERLPRESARLPTFDGSANGRRSEVDSDPEHTGGYGPEKNEPANPLGANFFRRPQVEIVLLANGT